MEEADEESFGGFLQRLDSLTLPSVRAAFVGSILADFSYLAALAYSAGAVWLLYGLLTSRWNGARNRSKSVVFWYFRISCRATVPGL